MDRYLGRTCNLDLTYLDEHRVRTAVRKLLPASPFPSELNYELERIDAVLVARIEAVLSRLDIDSRNSVLTVLESFRLGVAGQPEGDKVGARVEREGIYLAHDLNEGNVIYRDPIAPWNLNARLDLLRILSRLERTAGLFINKNQAAMRARSELNRRFGIYRDALAAYREQYRFIHELFDRDRAQALYHLVPVLEHRAEPVLKREGVLEFGEFNRARRTYYPARAHGPDLATKLRNYLADASNVRFFEDVNLAFKLSESEYARQKAAVPRIVWRQRLNESRRQILRWLRR